MRRACTVHAAGADEHPCRLLTPQPPLIHSCTPAPYLCLPSKPRKPRAFVTAANLWHGSSSGTLPSSSFDPAHTVSKQGQSASTQPARRARIPVRQTKTVSWGFSGSSAVLCCFFRNLQCRANMAAKCFTLAFKLLAPTYTCVGAVSQTQSPHLLLHSSPVQLLR
jgi:hypothetical protein